MHQRFLPNHLAFSLYYNGAKGGGIFLLPFQQGASTLPFNAVGQMPVSAISSIYASGLNFFIFSQRVGDECECTQIFLEDFAKAISSLAPCIFILIL